MLSLVTDLLLILGAALLTVWSRSNLVTKCEEKQEINANLMYNKGSWIPPWGLHIVHEKVKCGSTGWTAYTQYYTFSPRVHLKPGLQLTRFGGIRSLQNLPRFSLNHFDRQVTHLAALVHGLQDIMKCKVHYMQFTDHWLSPPVACITSLCIRIYIYPERVWLKKTHLDRSKGQVLHSYCIPKYAETI